MVNRANLQEGPETHLSPAAGPGSSPLPAATRR